MPEFNGNFQFERTLLIKVTGYAIWIDGLGDVSRPSSDCIPPGLPTHPAAVVDTLLQTLDVFSLVQFVVQMR